MKKYYIDVSISDMSKFFIFDDLDDFMSVIGILAFTSDDVKVKGFGAYDN